MDVNLALDRVLQHIRQSEANPQLHELRELQRASGGWGRIGKIIYFNRGAVRLRLDASRCPTCRSEDCPHMQAVLFVRARLPQEL